MRITIHWKGDTLDFGVLGKVPTTRIIMNVPVSQAFKKVGWRNWWKIRKIYRNKPFKCKWTVEAAEELKLMSCDLEKELLKMMSEELDKFKAQQDLEYIDRHKDEIIKATGIPPEYLGEWPKEVIKQNADKIRQLVDQDALDQLKRLNEKITIDNPDELHVKVPGDRIYPYQKGEWPEETIRRNAQLISDEIDKEIMKDLRKLAEKQVDKRGYPIKGE